MCSTHDLLECNCGGKGVVLSDDSAFECDDEKSEAPLRVNELMKWEHHSSPFNKDVLEVGVIYYLSVLLKSNLIQYYTVKYIAFYNACLRFYLFSIIYKISFKFYFRQIYFFLPVYKL